jgi:hypothetical protein
MKGGSRVALPVVSSWLSRGRMINGVKTKDIITLLHYIQKHV